MTDYTSTVQTVGRVADLWLPVLMQYREIPGLSVAIAYNGDTLYERGFGWACREEGVCARPDTVYRIASISKTVTAVAIMQLVDVGTIDLDDTVASCLSWFQEDSVKDVTIRQLLSHTAGIFQDGTTAHWVTGEFPDELASSIGDRATVYPAGARFKYSNYGFATLGAVIEQMSGKSYREYITRHILEPLGMMHTYTELPSEEQELAVGYSRPMPADPQHSFDHYMMNAYIPAAGLLMNVRDLTTFMSALNRSEIVSDQSKHEMMRSHVQITEDEDYGLGLDISTIAKRAVVGHTGNCNGFGLAAYGVPDEGVTVTVLSNFDGEEAAGISDGLLQLIFHIADHWSSFTSSEERQLEAYEGVYRHTFDHSIVARVGTNLIAFPVSDMNPTKMLSRLVPSESDGLFESVANGPLVDYAGEPTIFNQMKDGKAHKMFTGPSPLVRDDEAANIPRS